MHIGIHPTHHLVVLVAQHLAATPTQQVLLETWEIRTGLMVGHTTPVMWVTSGRVVQRQAVAQAVRVASRDIPMSTRMQ